MSGEMLPVLPQCLDGLRLYVLTSSVGSLAMLLAALGQSDLSISSICFSHQSIAERSFSSRSCLSPNAS